MIKRFLAWLLGLFSFGGKSEEPSSSSPDTRSGEDTTEPASGPPPGRTIIPLLIYPSVSQSALTFSLGRTVEMGGARYYTADPWEVDVARIEEAVRRAEDWLATALGTRIIWERVRTAQSARTLDEWRSRNIGLIRDEVERLGLQWTQEHIYLAFVRGMGGYAGGVAYEDNAAGFAMVGDVCLEAVCGYEGRTAGLVLLGETGWPQHSYGLLAQTGAFVHEALHGLDLPHPDGWPEDDRPDWNETLMGHWWNYPEFQGGRGLTEREVRRVMRWVEKPEQDV